ncbi:MAG: HAD-IIIA family hydrolase [Candidatus Cloacimonetes bacterium]|nr:HAD-IIIA family hydrolase [Candidatus Cloacimonadota bacterium]HPM03176.1 HAD-IIIA family hydrolase [Candidatus Cloacimonadota bacterium]
MNKVVFIDRDGTINLDEKGYIAKPEDFHLYDFSPDAIRLLNQLGFKVIVVSNQSGIARGLYSEADLDLIHQKMLKTLADQQACIDKAYYCPYYKEAVLPQYREHLEMRKPDLGMFYQACRDFEIHVNASFMIGDKKDDIEFGKKAHLCSILVLTGNGSDLLPTLPEWQYKPDYVAQNLLSACQLIQYLQNNKPE